MEFYSYHSVKFVTIRISVLLNEINRSILFELDTIKLNILAWWLNAGGTPVLIPNTEVKTCSADGTRKGRVGSRQTKVLNKWQFRVRALFIYPEPVEGL